MSEKRLLKASIEQFFRLKKAFEDEIESYVKERLLWNKDQRAKYRDDKLTELIHDPLTDLIYKLLGKKKPKAYTLEDLKRLLTAKDETGDPVIYTPVRPNVLGYIFSVLPTGIKAYSELATSGTTMKKLIAQPLNYLIDRIKAFARILVRRKIPYDAENPILVGLYGAPAYTIALMLSMFLTNVENPIERVIDIKDVISGTIDPKKFGPVDLLGGVPSYIAALIDRGLELAEGATVMYTAEPMPIWLKRKLEEEYKARIISAYGSTEVWPIAFGPEGEIEIVPDINYITIQPVKVEDSEFVYGDIRELRNFEKDLYHRIFFTPLSSPTMFNLDIGDVVLFGGTSELGLPTVAAVNRGLAHVKAYEIGSKDSVYLGTVEGYISPYVRVGVYSLPADAFGMALNSIYPGTKFLLLGDNTEGKYYAIVDREVNKKEFLELARTNSDFYYNAYILYVFGNIEQRLEFRTCPELLEAHFKNIRRKAYEGIVVERRIDGPYRDKCK